MSNATISHYIYAAILSATLPFVYSCGGVSKEQQEAENLLISAKQLIENKQYDNSIVLLDSLCKTYPKEFDLVKEAMHVKATALEQKFTIMLAQADSVIAVNAPIVESISSKFKVVKSPEMVEGYRVVKNIAGTPLINRTGIEPRIDDGGNLYIVSLLNGHSIHHNKLIASVKGKSSAETASIPYDEARNYRFDDNGVSNEMVTFRFDECEDFCKFIADNSNENITLTFSGKKSYSMPLPTAVKQAIIDSYSYSSAIRTGLEAEKNKMLLQKKIEVAKNQIERTKVEKE